jgi:peptidoglycan-associated lipoprotein
MLTACSGGPRTEPQTTQRATPPTIAPLPEPSIEALQELSDVNSVLSKRSIYYRNNEYTVAKQYLPLIQAHGEFLGAHPDFALRVEGNCDERGSSAYNLALGQRRADFVKRALVVLGANPTQITAVSLGAERPKGRGRTEAARAENRRSDLLYIGVDTR